MGIVPSLRKVSAELIRSSQPLVGKYSCFTGVPIDGIVDESARGQGVKFESQSTSQYLLKVLVMRCFSDQNSNATTWLGKPTILCLHSSRWGETIVVVPLN